MAKATRRLAAVLAAALSYAAPLAAFTLEPISALLAPSGEGSIATFRIANDGKERVAIKASVLTRIIAPDGKETNEAAGGLFVVYPARLLVEPGASSSLKIQWKGPARLEAERCFRLLAEQLPLSSGEAQGSGIRVRFRYLASIYVGMAGFKPELEASARGELGEDGRSGILVNLENKGGRHVVAIGLGLELLDGKGGALSLGGDELAPLDGANFLPGFPRSLFIPREGVEAGTIYAARADYKAEY
jgi:fimbrial chaperone protein